MFKCIVGLLSGTIFYLLDNTIGIFFRKKNIKLQEKSNVLVVSSTGIGNLMLLTSMLNNIKKALPKSNISVLVRKNTEEILKGNKDVDNIIIYPLEKSIVKKLLFFIKLRKNRFDVAFYSYPNVDVMSAVLLFITGARCRINFTYKIGAYSNCRFLNTKSVPVEGLKHDIERNLDLLRACNLKIYESSKRLFLPLSIEDENYASKALKDKLDKADILVGIHLGSGHPSKIWPIENFAILIRKILSLKNARILLVGGEQERRIASEQEFLKDKRIFNFVGETSIKQTSALIKKCRLFVTNDSGPMHIAAALNVKVVAIFLASNVFRTAPWGSRHIVILKKDDGWKEDKNKNHVYVDDINPDIVFKQVRKHFKNVKKQ